MNVFKWILSVQRAFPVAWQALLANRLRTVLACIGVMLGVGSVVAMLAIGKGARQEIMQQLKVVGSNNIVVLPYQEIKKVEKFGKSERIDEKPIITSQQGLSLQDAASIKEILPTAECVSAEVWAEMQVSYQQKYLQTNVLGVQKDFFKLINLPISEGFFFQSNQYEYGEGVCIIGSSLQAKLFSGENAIGKYLKCGKEWLKVVGVMQQRPIIQTDLADLGIRNFNLDLYVPMKTFFNRYYNFFPIQVVNDAGQTRHEIGKITIRIQNSSQLLVSAEVIKNILSRRHTALNCFRIIIPEQLIEQKQQTQRTLNWVLGAIASITLVVGGINILTIMLSAITERTKEIGIRRVAGATKTDIGLQFLLEALLICLSGGIVGVFVGIILTYILAEWTKIPVIISGFSVVMGLGVALFAGLAFGLQPARKAASQNPIESLRYE
jgi:putative ABC transport system permease protein